MHDLEAMSEVPNARICFSFREACEKAGNFAIDYQCEAQIVQVVIRSKQLWRVMAPTDAVRRALVIEAENKRMGDELYEEQESSRERGRSEEAWHDRYGMRWTAP